MYDSLSQYELHHAVCMIMIVSASISNGSQLTMTIRQPQTTASISVGLFTGREQPLCIAQHNLKTQLSTTATLQQRLRNNSAAPEGKKGKTERKKKNTPPPPPIDPPHTHTCN